MVGAEPVVHFRGRWVVVDLWQNETLTGPGYPAFERALEKSSVKDKEGALKAFREAADGKSNADARDIAKDILGERIFWDWDLPKTREGYYHYTGGVEAAIKRELAFAPYADMIWLETKLPDLEQARYFSRKIREKYPGK